MEKAHEILKEVFGFSSFRLSQEAVIHRLLVDNENALVLFPTGGKRGKSLTYQVPALCLDGLTLVISPLIALMKDQVSALRDRGVKASNLDSTLDAGTSNWVKSEVLNGSLKLLYVAPERLNNESFVAMMKQVKVSLLAVDESHCISQWGASFRPEYLKIARFAEELDVERVLCLTATATKTVADDICKSFFIDPAAGVFRTPVYRSNLGFQVQVAKDLDEKIQKLLPYLQNRTGPSIIYVTLQRHAEEVANLLRPHGHNPMVYHAGLPSEERERVQNEFMQCDDAIVCCTIAFGMGIDRANVRLVAHLYMPKTLENYSQEVGRAGRDGHPSTCLMFLSAPDIPILEGFARGDTCAKKDLQLWLQEVAMKEPSMDGTLDFNLYQQSKLYDIRSNVLNLCYAQLELDYSFIRAVTPFYVVYDLSAKDDSGWQKVLADKSPAAMTIRNHWSRKASGYQIDTIGAASTSGMDRAELSKHISIWELNGYVNSKGSQVRARYAVINPLPKDAKGVEELAELLHQRMLGREDEAVQKIREVINFATDDDCLAHSLAKYFGDEASIPDGMCNACTWCQTTEAVRFDLRAETVADPQKVRAILAACPERDDPRLLARMAFGITSPRLTAGKWSTYHPLFGSMVDVDFNILVQTFDVECKKVGYTRTETTDAPTTTKKRTYTQSSSSSYNNYSSGSRGHKRGGRGGYNNSGYTKRARR
ncbi:hypothetical protein JAAARDRAFT_119479 [Jaapia argillacea MUCL 33604]|uniref:ATP-dependent DNA helicase n=1 Tax=Jaapia argillacea MUCL 33604 TaxID=933084 RepID=A0A067QBG3_9AGAM|nr:hypothetical protein JAAARDRAFT_119479 [Jaapia argillacea MUCL 33604]